LSEVRTLSQRSASAAKEIKDLIRESVTKVESGSSLVNQSGETLAQIVNAVEEVATRVEDIATAASEQHDGIGQINQAVMQMDDMTQQNAALVEEASASSEALSEQASALNQLVSFFSVDTYKRVTPGSSPSAGRQQPIATGHPTFQSQENTPTNGMPPIETNSAPSEDSVIKYGKPDSGGDDDWEEF